jgi:hypothetical protein
MQITLFLKGQPRNGWVGAQSYYYLSENYPQILVPFRGRKLEENEFIIDAKSQFR